MAQPGDRRSSAAATSACTPRCGCRRSCRRGEAEIIVVDPQPHMTYQPFLPEAAAGSVEPRHVVVPLRRMLRSAGCITGARHRADPRREAGPDRAGRGRGRSTVSYDVLVVAAGLGRAHAADPRAGRARHRLQDHRRGHLPAQPRAVPARRGRLHRRPRAAAAGAHVHVRRRRLRRRRGAGRAGGHGPLREPALLPAASPDDMRWVLVEATGPDHARGRPGDGPPTPSSG